MNVTTVLSEEIRRVKISSDEKKYLEKLGGEVVKQIQKKLKRKKIDASVFIGGSVAKETVVRKKNYDIDIFIRFNKKYSEEQIKKMMFWLFFLFRIRGIKLKIRKIHGSRDYIRIIFKKDKHVMAEIVPTLRISSPEEGRNITDLSYFHVEYIRNQCKKNKNISDEIILAKSFCHGQKCYGAESYINGFSGYALELLVCYYGGFLKFLKEAANAQGQIIIDPAKHYKTRAEVLEKLNAAKKQSPIIIIDPTFKERNAAVALSKETFNRFKKAAAVFIENPSNEYFEHKKADLGKLREHAKENEGIFGIIELKTNKQPGDIAGTKLIKFSKVLLREIERYFEVLKEEFEYHGEKKAHMYLVLKKKNEIVTVGPALNYKEAVINFKKAHPIWYVEDGHIKCAHSTDIKLKYVLKRFKKSNKKQIKEMAIKRIRVV
ncbi:MAG: nucleotidyltransferase domain-containing protein [Candidatus Pacearchaeota archaeon]|jgi:tRNA CCA-adding enzyme